MMDNKDKIFKLFDDNNEGGNSSPYKDKTDSTY